MTRFKEALDGWTQGRLTQAEAALLLGQCERSFRRHIERYQADGLDGLLDKRLSQISKRRASGAEVDHVVALYKSGFAGWNVAHFHTKYKAECAGARSYSWLKTVLQGAGVVKASKRRGKHRIKRERAPLPGMLMHQDASTHRWVANQVWDLVVTMDDATGEHSLERLVFEKILTHLELKPRPSSRGWAWTTQDLAARAATAGMQRQPLGGGLRP